MRKALPVGQNWVITGRRTLDSSSQCMAGYIDKSLIQASRSYELATSAQRCLRRIMTLQGTLIRIAGIQTLYLLLLRSLTTSWTLSAV